MCQVRCEADSYLVTESHRRLCERGFEVHHVCSAFARLHMLVSSLSAETRVLAESTNDLSSHVYQVLDRAANTFAATGGDATSFSSSRLVSAWPGMVPRREATGSKVLGKDQLAWQCVSAHIANPRGPRRNIRAERRPDQADPLYEVLARRNKNIAAVALAERMPRNFGIAFKVKSMGVV